MTKNSQVRTQILFLFPLTIEIFERIEDVSDGGNIPSDVSYSLQNSTGWVSLVETLRETKQSWILTFKSSVSISIKIKREGNLIFEKKNGEIQRLRYSSSNIEKKGFIAQLGVRVGTSYVVRLKDYKPVFVHLIRVFT